MDFDLAHYDGDGYEFSVRLRSKRMLVHVTRDALAVFDDGDCASQLTIFIANAERLCDIACRLQSSAPGDRIVITAEPVFSASLHLHRQCGRLRSPSKAATG